MKPELLEYMPCKDCVMVRDSEACIEARGEDGLKQTANGCGFESVEDIKP